MILRSWGVWLSWGSNIQLHQIFQYPTISMSRFQCCTFCYQPALIFKYFYRPQRSCEGCFYTCVSVHGGGLPQCMLGYHPPGPETPPGPGTLPLPADTLPPGPGTPRSRHPLGPGTPPPPTQQTATVADGTHPTGMHSCYDKHFWTKPSTLLFCRY